MARLALILPAVLPCCADFLYHLDAISRSLVKPQPFSAPPRSALSMWPQQAAHLTQPLAKPSASSSVELQQAQPVQSVSAVGQVRCCSMEST